MKPPTPIRTPVVLTVALTVAIFFALAWVSPYWSVAGLLQAAANEDVGRAARYIQEPHLEQGIRSQTSDAVRSQALKGVAAGWPDAERALASDKSAPLAATLSDLPAITQLIRTHIPVEGSRIAAAWNLARSDNGEWVSANEYRVKAPGDYVFSWRRATTSWQLVDVSIPPHVIEAASITGESPVIEPLVETFTHPNERME